MKIAIFNPYFESLGGGEKVTAVMAARLSEKHQVSVLVKQPVDKVMVGKYFAVDLSKVEFTVMPKENLVVRLLAHRYSKLPGRWKSMLYDYSGLVTLRRQNNDLFINNLYQSNLPSPAPKSIYMCMFPQKLVIKLDHPNAIRATYARLTDIMENHFLGSREKAINSYTTITANSKYTAGWIKKYWDREATVVYPVCDDMGPPVPKKNIILSVGRFFADNGSSHHKKHHELVKAFVKLDRPDWELHLAGSAGPDHDTAKYLDMLTALAKGHDNIHVHANAPFKDLQRLYKEASIYWHATGLGYDALEFPENQEHFGITTVEAMTAGVVPVVINTAGQLEAVSDGVNGLLWSDIDQLITMTNRLIDNPEMMKKMSREAVKSSTLYNRESFLKVFDRLILDTCND